MFGIGLNNMKHSCTLQEDTTVGKDNRLLMVD